MLVVVVVVVVVDGDEGGVCAADSRLQAELQQLLSQGRRLWPSCPLLHLQRANQGPSPQPVESLSAVWGRPGEINISLCLYITYSHVQYYGEVLATWETNCCKLKMQRYSPKFRQKKIIVDCTFNNTQSSQKTLCLRKQLQISVYLVYMVYLAGRFFQESWR